MAWREPTGIYVPRTHQGILYETPHKLTPPPTSCPNEDIMAIVIIVGLIALLGAVPGMSK